VADPDMLGLLTKAQAGARGSMYILMLVLLMGLLPLASILVEVRRYQHPLSAELVRRWFVFWAVGVRLLTAGISQIVQPQFTAEAILGFESDEVVFMIRELGFANTAVGSAAVASVVARSWTLPLALIGAVFYGFAGVNHILHDERNPLQNAAMISDLFVALVLFALCLAALRQRR
jgi:hypothetical protein